MKNVTIKVTLKTKRSLCKADVDYQVTRIDNGVTAKIENPTVKLVRVGDWLTEIEAHELSETYVVTTIS